MSNFFPCYVGTLGKNMGASVGFLKSSECCREHLLVV